MARRFNPPPLTAKFRLNTENPYVGLPLPFMRQHQWEQDPCFWRSPAGGIRANYWNCPNRVVWCQHRKLPRYHWSLDDTKIRPQPCPTRTICLCDWWWDCWWIKFIIDWKIWCEVWNLDKTSWGSFLFLNCRPCRHHPSHFCRWLRPGLSMWHCLNQNREDCWRSRSRGMFSSSSSQINSVLGVIISMGWCPTSRWRRTKIRSLQRNFGISHHEPSYESQQC